MSKRPQIEKHLAIAKAMQGISPAADAMIEVCSFALDLERQNAELLPDKERLDWLDLQTVELTADGKLLFWRRGGSKASPLREYIDDSREVTNEPEPPA